MSGDMNGDDLERRLEGWGGQPVPPPDASYTERLERDLRSQAYFSPAPDTAPTPWYQRAFRPALLLGGGAVAVLVAVLVFSSGNGAREVVMSQALGANVTLPGQGVASASSGDTLPDGTRISIEPDGSAVVDGVVLGGGTEAVVVDGRIEILITAPTATPEPDGEEAAPVGDPTPTAVPTRPPPTARPTPTTAPTARPTTPPTQATPVPTSRPAATPTRQPEPTRTPTTSPTSTPTAEPTATPTLQPAPVDPGPLQVSLQAERLTARRALLFWQAVNRDDIAGWEVLAITGDGARSIALLRDPQIRELRIERPENLDTRFRVRARNADGDILGQSNAVRFPLGD